MLQSVFSTVCFVASVRSVCTSNQAHRFNNQVPDLRIL